LAIHPGKEEMTKKEKKEVDKESNEMAKAAGVELEEIK